MSPDLLLSVLRFALYTSGVFLFGWAAREWHSRREAERFVRHAWELDARDRRAREERLHAWHVEAETDEEAIAAFHRRAPGLGAGGTL